MDPLLDPAAAEMLGAARRMLEGALTETHALDRRVAALADDTAWSARAMGRYREGMAALSLDLAHLRALMEGADADLAALLAGAGPPLGSGPW